PRSIRLVDVIGSLLHPWHGRDRTHRWASLIVWLGGTSLPLMCTGAALTTKSPPCLSAAAAAPCDLTADTAYLVGTIVVGVGLLLAVLAWAVGVVQSARVQGWRWHFFVAAVPLVGALVYASLCHARCPRCDPSCGGRGGCPAWTSCTPRVTGPVQVS